ncbi:hypothetical protein D9M69_340040 [compost metagenome]
MPLMLAMICGLLSSKSWMVPTPFSIVPEPVMRSNSSPRPDRLRKSSVAKRSSPCRLSTPSSRAAPGSTLRIWPFSRSSDSLPDNVG